MCFHNKIINLKRRHLAGTSRHLCAEMPVDIRVYASSLAGFLKKIK